MPDPSTSLPSDPLTKGKKRAGTACCRRCVSSTSPESHPQPPPKEDMGASDTRTHQTFKCWQLPHIAAMLTLREQQGPEQI